MSFILDALKKSEKERQRDAVPGINDLPIVVHEPRGSFWVLAVIGGLGLCIVVLAWAWWRAAMPARLAATPQPAELRVTELPPAVPPRTVAPVPTRNLAGEAAQAASRSEPAAAAPTRRVVSAPAVVTTGPMSIVAARASGMAVPELTLELHVYSPETARRFVFINSRKYVEGETLREGPRVEEITSEGAILSFAGQNFLLPRD